MKLSRIQISMTGALLAAATLHAQEDEIMDIRGLAGESFWEANWPWLVPAGIVTLLVMVFLIRAVVKKLNRPRPLTARERALKQLSEARSVLDDGQPEADKRFSFAVSDALRGYLERTFGLRAPEQTTEEFLATAQHSPLLSRQALGTLGEFLQLCDLAKFARHAFGPDERERLLDTAKSFVEQSDQQAPQTQPAASGQTPFDERAEVEGEMRKLIAPTTQAASDSSPVTPSPSPVSGDDKYAPQPSPSPSQPTAAPEKPSESSTQPTPPKLPPQQ